MTYQSYFSQDSRGQTRPRATLGNEKGLENSLAPQTGGGGGVMRRMACLVLLVVPALVNAVECPSRTSTPRAVPAPSHHEITLATQNVLRLFDDEDEGPGQVVTSWRYQQRLDKLSRQMVDVLHSPDVVAVQEAENIKVLEDLAAVITAFTQTRNTQKIRYQSVLLEGSDRGGIDVGFLVRDHITVLGAEQLLGTRRLGKAALFDRPPLLLRLKTAQGRVLELINAHLKSLRGSDDPVVAKKTARKRQLQAQALAAWVGLHLGKNPQSALIVLGDFNATPEILGGVDVLGILQAQGLKNTADYLPVSERYTYVYKCRPEALDHVLVSPALQASVKTLAVSRGNAGVPWRFDRQDGTALHSSDHDGLVLYLKP